MLRISFCTVVRNRLHHLKLTLPQNLHDNQDYQKLQFVILDYNSDDGLSQWIKENMMSQIQSGRLVYYRTDVPQYFHRGHSRNMAFKLADGDILCNIDADNFTGKGFARYVNDSINNQKLSFLAASASSGGDFLGRICCRSKDFYSIGGYDERMSGYGFEDIDLRNRLIQRGLYWVEITDASFFNAIFHSDEERIAQERSLVMLDSLYLRHISACETELIYFFQDKLFNRGILVDCNAKNTKVILPYACKEQPEYEFTLASEGWKEGSWQETGKSIDLISAGNTSPCSLIKEQKGSLRLNNKVYYKLTDKAAVVNLVFFHSQYKNRILLNKKQPAYHSPVSFIGAGSVFKNFDHDILLQV
jgi:hypothetical protein